MSTNRFKSNVLNRFINNNTHNNTTENSNDHEQGGSVRENFSVFRRQGNFINSTTNNALSSISSITSAALSLIKTNKSQVSHTLKNLNLL